MGLGPFTPSPVRPAAQLYPTPIPFNPDDAEPGQITTPPDSPLVNSPLYNGEYSVMYLMPVVNADAALLQAVMMYGWGSYQIEQAVTAANQAQLSANAIRLSLQRYNLLLSQWEEDAQAMGQAWVAANPPPQVSADPNAPYFPELVPLINAWNVDHPDWSSTASTAAAQAKPVNAG